MPSNLKLQLSIQSGAIEPKLILPDTDYKPKEGYLVEGFAGEPDTIPAEIRVAFEDELSALDYCERVLNEWTNLFRTRKRELMKRQRREIRDGSSIKR